MAEIKNYAVRGNVQANGGYYIRRKADRELLEYCRSATFAYVLSSRQVGKTSLMMNTAATLLEEGIAPVIVDLQTIGVVNVTPENWYKGIINIIAGQLPLETAVNKWWRENQQFSLSQRFSLFLETVIIKEVKQPVVIFVDEIDTCLSLPFTDDFFSTIRALYTTRALKPELKRISFVLIGVATPADLIKDQNRTPFNIGSRVEMTDFTVEEALELAQGFSLPEDNTRQVIEWVIDWTKGHPYLTHRLCQVLAASETSVNLTRTEVEAVVRETFFGAQSETDDNLLFVRDMLLKRAPDVGLVLYTYERIRLGKRPVRDEEQSVIKSHLKLSGVVQSTNRRLVIRNPIYNEVFDRKWIKEHAQTNWSARLFAVFGYLGAALTVILVLSTVLGVLIPLLLFVWGQSNALQAEQAEKERQVTIAKNNQATAEANRLEALKVKEEAETQKQEAQKQSNLASSRKLALQSNNYASTQQDLALLLGYEALSAAETSEAKGSLLQVIQNNPSLASIIRTESFVQTIALSPDGKTLASSSGNNNIILWDVASRKQLGIISRASSGNLNKLVFSPDGKMLASAGGDNNIRLWDVKTLKQVGAPFTGHTAPIWSIAFSPIGNTIVSGSSDRTVRVWDVSTHKQVKTPTLSHSSIVFSVAFSPDGKWIASAGRDTTIRLWDAKTFALVTTFTGHTLDVNRLAFSPDSNLLASVSRDDTARLWDVNNRKPYGKVLTGHTNDVWGVAFSPDGKTLATSGSDRNIIFWDVATQTRHGNSLTGHDNQVREIVFGTDGTTLFSGSYDGTIRFWKVKPARSVTLSLPEVGHTSDIYAVKFSPNGKLVASAGGDNTIILWQFENQQLVKQTALTGHTGTVNSLAFGPDGKFLVSGSSDKTVRLWDVADGRQLATFDGHSETVRSVAFNPTTNLAASSGDDGIILLWDVEKQIRLGQPLKGHSGSVYSIVFSPDGKTLASSGYDGQILIWDVTSQQRIGNALTDPDNSTIKWNIVFSPDGKTLASAGDDLLIWLWDVEKRERKGTALKGHTNTIWSMAFSPDGRTLVSASSDNTLRLWDVASYQQLGSTINIHNNAVWAVDFSPDGKYLVSGSSDRTVILTDVQARQTIGDRVGTVWQLAFNNDGTTLASASGGKKILFWDVKNSSMLSDRTIEEPKDVYTLAINPKNNVLATSGQNFEIHLWDLAAPKSSPLSSLKVHTNTVNSLVYSPDGKLLASAGWDKTVRFWNLENNTLLNPTPVLSHTEVIWKLAFSPDGKILASGSRDKTIQLWDVSTQKPLGEPLTGHTSDVYSLAFSPNGQFLASGGSDNSIILWDVKSHQRIGSVMRGHTNTVRSLAFSLDGTILVSGSNDNTIRLWDVTTTLPLGDVFGRHSGGVYSLAFSPDGKVLASGSEDKTVKIWEINFSSVSLKEAACQLAGRNLSQEEWVRFFGEIPYRKTCQNLPVPSSVISNIIVKTKFLAAQGDKQDEIMNLYIKAQELVLPDDNPVTLNSVCWWGSLHGFASLVMPSCIKAASLAPDLGSIRDTRGLARALTGDFAGAIEDFRYFMDWVKDTDAYVKVAQKREEWIRSLEKGINPFDPATIDELQKE